MISKWWFLWYLHTHMIHDRYLALKNVWKSTQKGQKGPHSGDLFNAKLLWPAPCTYRRGVGQLIPRDKNSPWLHFPNCNIKICLLWKKLAYKYHLKDRYLAIGRFMVWYIHITNLRYSISKVKISFLSLIVTDCVGLVSILSPVQKYLVWKQKKLELSSFWYFFLPHLLAKFYLVRI